MYVNVCVLIDPVKTVCIGLDYVFVKCSCLYISCRMIQDSKALIVQAGLANDHAS